MALTRVQSTLVLPKSSSTSLSTIVHLKIGNLIEVVRSRNPRELLVLYQGAQYNDIQAQKIIEKVFGSYTVWISSSYIKQGQRAWFATATNAERFDFIRELLFPVDPESYLNQIKEKVQEMEGAYRNALDKFQKKTRRYSDLVGQYGVTKEDYMSQKALTKMEEDIRELQGVLRNLNGLQKEEMRKKVLQDTLLSRHKVLKEELEGLKKKNPLPGEGEKLKKRAEKLLRLSHKCALQREYKNVKETMMHHLGYLWASEEEMDKDILDAGDLEGQLVTWKRELDALEGAYPGINETKYQVEEKKRLAEENRLQQVKALQEELRKLPPRLTDDQVKGILEDIKRLQEWKLALPSYLEAKKTYEGFMAALGNKGGQFGTKELQHMRYIYSIRNQGRDWGRKEGIWTEGNIESLVEALSHRIKTLEGILEEKKTEEQRQIYLNKIYTLEKRLQDKKKAQEQEEKTLEKATKDMEGLTREWEGVLKMGASPQEREVLYKRYLDFKSRKGILEKLIHEKRWEEERFQEREKRIQELRRSLEAIGGPLEDPLEPLEEKIHNLSLSLVPLTCPYCSQKVLFHPSGYLSKEEMSPEAKKATLEDLKQKLRRRQQGEQIKTLEEAYSRDYAVWMSRKPTLGDLVKEKESLEEIWKDFKDDNWYHKILYKEKEYQSARQRHAEVQKRLKTLSVDLQDLEKDLQGTQMELAKLPKPSLDHLSKDIRPETLRNRLATLKGVLGDLISTMGDALPLTEKEIDQHYALQDFLPRWKLLEGSLASLKEADRDERILQDRIREKEEVLSRYREITDKKRRIEKAIRELETQKVSYTDLRGPWKQIQELRDRITKGEVLQRLQDIKKNMDSLTEDTLGEDDELGNLDTLDPDVIRKLLQEANNAYQEHEKLIMRYERLQREISRLEGEFVTYEDYQPRIEALEREIKEKQERLERGKVAFYVNNKGLKARYWEKQMQMLQEDVVALQKLHRHSKETVYYILDDLVSQLNEELNDILGRLFEDPIGVSINMFRTNKNGTVRPCVGINVQYRGQEYDKLEYMSGGEGDRVSLALTLALHKIIKSPMLLLDESFGALNFALRKACLISIGQFMTRGSVVVCINHEDTEGNYENCITLPIGAEDVE